MFGGGLQVFAGVADIRHTTITSNTAVSDGGGIVVNSAAVTATNTTIAGNSAPNENNVWGSLAPASSFNLLNQSAVSAGLGTFKNHGGPTLTVALLSGSPAIDAGDSNFNPNAFSPPLVNDQRGSGFDRVKAGRTDIGAFEVQNQAPVSTSPDTASVAENTQPVHALTALDADLLAQTVTYSVLGSVPAGDLGPGGILQAGESIFSPDALHRLDMQADGNLVAYGPGGPVWSSGTGGSAANRVFMQVDGNLVLTDAAANVVWASGSVADTGSLVRLHFQNDGQLVIYRVDGVRLWESAIGDFSGGGTVYAVDPLALGFVAAADNGQFKIVAGNQL